MVKENTLKHIMKKEIYYIIYSLKIETSKFHSHKIIDFC